VGSGRAEAAVTERQPVTVQALQNLIAHDSAFTKPYGFVVKSAGGGLCSLAVPHLPHLERPGGVASGQVIMTAADVAMWLAIKTLRGIDDPSVTSHMETQFLQGVRGAFLCHAEVLKSGRRTTFGIARCVSETGDLLAYHTLTYVMP
jgi:acyl-coenzyme A thioesterase PaaI-like protein